MALTSNQKHYIRKNIKNLPPEKIAIDLGLDKKTVLAYLEKKLPKEKFEKLTRKNFPTPQSDPSNFSFNEFFSQNLGIFLSLFFLIFLGYFNVLESGFVSDDIAAIEKNPASGTFSAVFDTYGIGFFQNFIYFSIYNLFGASPSIFHLSNVLFHLGSTFLVFTILSLIAKKRVAIFSAMLFAIHPILIESVTWISGSPYSISGFFLLLSFLYYLIYPEGRRKYLSFLFFFFALISLEKSASFPAILFLFEVSRGKIKTTWKRLTPFFSLSILWVLMFLFRITERKDAITNTFYQASPTNSGGHSFLQIPASVATYLKLIFWPQKLSLYQTEMNFSVWEYNLCILILLSLLGLISYFYQKNKPVFFWLSFFLIALAPTLLAFGLAWIVAERYAYLASLGIFVVVAMFFNWLLEKFEKYKNILYAFFAILILALSIRTILRNFDWKNEDTLWIATAKTSPSGENAHNNLGDVYSRQGDHEKAITEFQKAVEINPRYASAYHNLAIAQKETGRINEAIENYQKALEIDPQIWQSWQNLGVIYFEKEDYPKSAQYLQKALDLQPKNENLQKALDEVKKKM